MNQEVAVVRQNPLGVGEAFHADRIFAALIELLSDFFHNGLDLLRIAAAADHEKIRKGGDVAQVQHTNVQGFLRFGGSNSGEPRGDGDQPCGRLRGCVVLLSDG